MLANIAICDSLLLELRLWVIFVDDHFVNFDGLVVASMGDIWVFGDQFVGTRGDAA